MRIVLQCLHFDLDNDAELKPVKEMLERELQSSSLEILRAVRI